MKESTNTNSWANAFGIVGIALSAAIALRGCSEILIEKEKTEQIKTIHHHEKETKNG